MTRPRHLLVAALLSANGLFPLGAASAELCVDGMAGGFPCSNVHLLARLTPGALGMSSSTDNWGWTDPVTGVEYALVVGSQGTAFVDLSDPEAPLLVGNLPAHNGLSTGIRDVKVYADHAFVTADVFGHGMQVFDLSQLRDVVAPPVTFSETAHYSDLSDAHNIAIDEETGFAYPVSDGTCSGGLHMIDLSIPTRPVFAGCFADEGSLHDVQCVVYQGPDVEHVGQEICFASDPGSPDQLVIVDVTDKAAPEGLAAEGYPASSIGHQGWLTEDHAFFLMGDEGDETGAVNTRTLVWDVRDLDAPVLAGEYFAETFATDHNMYVKGSKVYQGNYRAGFRVLELVDPAAGLLEEVGFLDSRPGNDENTFSGAWSTFPFYDSGIFIGTDTAEGLFVMRFGAGIFADGFESGDTGAWDTTVP
jgi:choice-of-anchor B domain-containing protein